MSYQVISRKYRPQEFGEIIGQEHISNTLRNAIKNDRVAHAYLFTGSRGIGKTTTARILSKTLNCAHPQDFNPCNECISCREITDGRSVNVAEIDGASNRGINEIRELRENVKYPPTGGAKYRIFIIDEVHMLTKEAFNALLKTLEEPPPHVIFIFATTEPIKIPDTIISRCQRYDFHRIPVRSIVQMLQSIVKNEKVNIDDAILTLIAKKADGGMRDAESLLDQIISFSGDKVNFEDAQRILGLIDFEYYLELGNLILAHEKHILLNKAEEIFNKGVELSEFLEGFSEHFRNLLVANVSGSVEMLDLPDNAKITYREEAKKWHALDIMRIMKMIADARINLKTAINQRTFLEYHLLRLGSIDNTVDIQSILEKLDSINLSQPISAGQKKNLNPDPNTGSQKKPGSKTYKIPAPIKKDFEVAENSKIPEVRDKEVSLSGEEMMKKWKDIIHFVHEEKSSVAALLELAKAYSVEQGILKIIYTKKYKFQRNMVENHKTYLEKRISEIIKSQIKINFSLSENAEDDQEDPNSVDAIARQLADKFGGEIII
ncbi:MAG: DNA polymerase III subunit gamma/tau [Candidatus Marinimicrobia bacterium]|nr:DNA polymerase III subunit gamma/tau [Candidatus Neomarinimicrobiota bacterium]